MKSTILRRTFAALKAESPEERDRLNADALTSEYFTGSRYLLRTPALMSDGTPNPVQKFHDRTFRTRKEAELHA